MKKLLYIIGLCVLMPSSVFACLPYSNYPMMAYEHFNKVYHIPRGTKELCMSEYIDNDIVRPFKVTYYYDQVGICQPSDPKCHKFLKFVVYVNQIEVHRGTITPVSPFKANFLTNVNNYIPSGTVYNTTIRECFYIDDPYPDVGKSISLRMIPNMFK